MAYEIPGFAFTLPAGEDLSASQFCFIDLDGSGQCVLPSAGERAIAVIQNIPAAAVGSPVGLMQTGISKVLVGTGGVGAGDDVAADGDGAAVQAAGGDFIVGTALEAAAADGYAPVLLRSGTSAGS